MKIDYTNLSFTQLIDKIETNRFFDLPRMVREAFRRLLTRVEALEDAPTPSESFIPLSGTEEGSPVTGNIEFNELTEIYFDNTDYYKAINFGFEDEGINISSTSNISESTSFIQINPEYILIDSNNATSKGLASNTDYAEVEPENKLIYAQRSYVDNRGSVVNETTSALSASDLNTAYPNAKDGFSVIAPNVVGGGKYYIKAGAGWVYQQILAVV